MSVIRYLLDENVDQLYQAELLKREPTIVVWRIGTPGAPPKGTPDPDLLLWCERNSFVLVTNNRHSMAAHVREHLAQGKHIPGILIINPDMSVGETIEELLLIWGSSGEEEYLDRIVFLPISS